MQKIRQFIVLQGVVLFAVACGGGGDDGGEQQGNGKVSASFTSPTSAEADSTVAFDASASSSQDGGVLTYDWAFGGGNRGSGRTIARLFREAGTVEVTLTVADASGNRDTATRSLIINPPASVATVNAAGVVTGLDDLPLGGVTVTDRRSNASAVTDALGRVTLEVALGRGVALELVKDGYAGQLVALRFPVGTGADAAFSARMRTRVAAQDFDAKTGGMLAGEDGARVTFPADALVDGGGALRGGTAQLAMTPVDITLPAAGGFPGEFTGIMSDGSSTPIVSFGTTEYAIASNGDRLNLAPGKRAMIELPVYADTHLDGTAVTAGERIPLWSLDEQSGVWVNEGDGEIIASPDAPGGFIMRAEVGHFSWWNVDIGFDPTGIGPSCVPDVVPGAENFLADATICNMLADIDRGLGGNGSGFSNLVAQSVPRLPGFAATTTVPVNGGQIVQVPANMDLRLVGSALNGTWRGEAHIHTGASGATTNVPVVLRPIESVIDGEVVTLPFDETRTLTDATPVKLVFSSPGNKFVHIKISAGEGSSLTGNLSVRDSSGVLVTQAFGTTPVELNRAVVAPGPYAIEITGTGNLPGTFHLEASLVGTMVTEPLTLPIAGSHTLQALEIYRIQLTTTGALGLSGTVNGYNIRYRISGALGAAFASGTSPELSGYLPSAGTYNIDLYVDQGFSVGINFALQSTVWPNTVPELDLGPLGGYGSDTILLPGGVDQNGALVVGYVVGEGGGNARFELKRLSGSTLTAVATLDDLTYSPGCSAFAFDADNNPVVIDESPEGIASGGSPSLRVRRYVAGSWVNVGSTGRLPKVGAAGTQNCNQPFIALWNGELIVAYNIDVNVWVTTFDGTDWVPVGPSDGQIASAYAAPQSSPRSFALAVSPDGKPTIAHQPFSGKTSVAQFDGTSWLALGDELTYPLLTGALSPPKLAFDAANHPLVAGPAGYDSIAGEMFVFVWNGSAWSTSGPLRTSSTDGYAQSGEIDHVFFGGASITVNTETYNGSNATIVQRNDGTSWTSVGADRGQVDRLNQNFYRYLAVSGGQLYLVAQPQGSPGKITVRRYTP